MDRRSRREQRADDGRSDAARLRHRRAGVPALRWAPAFDCHGRRPRCDSRDPGRWYSVAGAGGPGAAVLAGAEHQPRCGNRGLSASGRRLRRGLFARVVGAVPSYRPSAPLPSRNPLTGRLSALYVGDERERRPLPWSDRTGWRAGVPTTAVPAGPLSRLCSTLQSTGFHGESERFLHHRGGGSPYH